jgi:hypothetical protein
MLSNIACLRNWQIFSNTIPIFEIFAIFCCSSKFFLWKRESFFKFSKIIPKKILWKYNTFFSHNLIPRTFAYVRNKRNKRFVNVRAWNKVMKTRYCNWNFCSRTVFPIFFYYKALTKPGSYSRRNESNKRSPKKTSSYRSLTNAIVHGQKSMKSQRNS